MTTEAETALNHAWRYFDLHAKQRIALFNFFVVLEGLILAGWASAMTGETPQPAVAVILGVLLTFFSLIFWKFDERNSFLTKRAEDALSVLEQDMPDAVHLFATEKEQTARAQDRFFLARQWSHGVSLRVLFVLSAVAGLFASAYALGSPS